MSRLCISGDRLGMPDRRFKATISSRNYGSEATVTQQKADALVELGEYMSTLQEGQERRDIFKLYDAIKWTVPTSIQWFHMYNKWKQTNL